MTEPALERKPENLDKLLERIMNNLDRLVEIADTHNKTQQEIWEALSDLDKRLTALESSK